MRHIKYLFPGLFLMIFSLISGCKFDPLKAGGTRTPSITFFEGNDATQDNLCTLRAPTNRVDSFVYQFTADNSPCENDEARSVVLHDLDAGVIVCIYDDGDCTRDDSTTKITVKRTLTSETIGSFEFEVLSNYVDVTLLRGGNLDGKVSCVTIGYADCQ
jgi:hypothetical protein